MRVLASKSLVLDETYVNVAFAAYCQKTGYLTQDQFTTLLHPDDHGPLAYKKSYAVSIRPALGLFLVALHSSNAITLPAGFLWPSTREDGKTADSRKRREIGKFVASELLQFIRSLDSQSEELPHPAFEAIGGDRKRREWFLTYGTKLLLATGWHKAEDVNIKDLLTIKAAESKISETDITPLAYKALLEVLKLAFGDRINITSADWSTALRTELGRLPRNRGKQGKGESSASLAHLFSSGPRSDEDLLEEFRHIPPLWGRRNRMRNVTRLPGLDVDIRSVSTVWLQLEDLYVAKTPRENYKSIESAFAWWNIYLFYYLLYWFARNPGTQLTFPHSPNLLTIGGFVSRLLPANEETPVTFVEFMNSQSESRKWTNNGYYATLHQLQEFFEFIERYSEEIPECAGFEQPLSTHDYPRTSRTKATKKQPVPRRFFGIYLKYHEALLAYHNVITSHVLSGTLSEVQLLRVISNISVIDTFATATEVGFIPILFTRTITIPLQFIPNILDLRWRTLKDGRYVYLPHPHGLHQNLTALHTGLRHNHIQWLDQMKFDSLVDDDDIDFALLFVNTDKQKKEPWSPHVNIRVIELLRAQRDWSKLIGEEGFESSHFYNDNASTKWPKFRPLFACTGLGKPHDDQTYIEIWQRTLCGLQGLMPQLREYGRGHELLRLLPPGHRAEDPDLARKLKAYGAQFGVGEYCRLNVMSSTSPHSARVAVVSQYITFLPTDLIGKYITGQKSGVVSYYVHLDRETLEAEQLHQAMRMRDAALRSAFEPILNGQQVSAAHIHADSINSNLSKSMRANLDETIISYGCISISFSDKATKGVDVLRETRGVNAAANKTEICPYGNNCPPEIVRQLRGWRRCSLCDYAVRTVDHLHAVVAAQHQVAEKVDELEALLATDSKVLSSKYSTEELDQLEDERARLCEDLTGWVLNEEVLELTRQKIVNGQETRTWIVQKPEIVERDLRRIATRTSMTEYVLTRLGECIAYPSLQGPQVRARFDLLRRELMARAGNLREAFSSRTPIDPASDCAGLLKSLVASTGKSLLQLADFLEQDKHMPDLKHAPLRLLSSHDE